MEDGLEQVKCHTESDILAMLTVAAAVASGCRYNSAVYYLMLYLDAVH